MFSNAALCHVLQCGESQSTQKPGLFMAQSVQLEQNGCVCFGAATALGEPSSGPEILMIVA